MIHPTLTRRVRATTGHHDRHDRTPLAGPSSETSSAALPSAAHVSQHEGIHRVALRREKGGDHLAPSTGDAGRHPSPVTRHQQPVKLPVIFWGETGCVVAVYDREI